MKKEIQLHPSQAEILKILLFNPQARFVQLNELRLSTDHFSFHIKSLMKEGLIVKTQNRYGLTVVGKEFAGRFDVDSAKVGLEKQAKISVAVAAVKKENGKTKYLLQKRLKQPYFGYQGFITGKIKWGETIEQAAAREFKEETGLTGSFTFKGVKHKMDYAAAGEMLEDKFFFVFRVDNLQGEFQEKIEGGQNFWLTKKQIFALPNLFHSVEDVIKMISQNKIIFSETKYKVSGY